MTIPELESLYRPVYAILHAELARRMAIYTLLHPDYSEVVRVQEALANLIVMKDELRRHLQLLELMVERDTYGERGERG